MSTTIGAAARLEARAPPRPARARAPATWCSTSISVAASSRVVYRQSARARRGRSSTLSNPLEPLLRRPQHRRRRIHRDHVRRQTARSPLARLAGAAAEIADASRRPRAKRGQRREMKAIAEAACRARDPTARPTRRRILRLGCRAGQRGLQPPLVLEPRPASGRPVRGRSSQSRRADGSSASRRESCRGGWSLRRATQSSRRRPAPSGAG